MQEKKLLCEWPKAQRRSVSMVVEHTESGLTLREHNRYKEMVKETLNELIHVDVHGRRKGQVREKVNKRGTRHVLRIC